MIILLPIIFLSKGSSVLFSTAVKILLFVESESSGSEKVIVPASAISIVSEDSSSFLVKSLTELPNSS